MKHFILTLLILLGFASAFGQTEPAERDSLSFEVKKLDIEFILGSGKITESNSGDLWSSSAALGLGVNYNYPISSRFQIRGGLSQQMFSSGRRVYNPYPYVMDMDINLLTLAARLSVGTRWHFIQKETGHTIFLGASVYMDKVYLARAFNDLHYLDEDDNEVLNLNDSFVDPISGLGLCLGTTGRRGSLELYYWQDLSSSSVERFSIGKLRRSSLGLSGTVFIGK